MFTACLSACFTWHMTRQKKLTKTQKTMLAESPHVVKVTDYYVFFSSAFINKFCVEYHAGKTANVILAENSIDPEVLEDSRIESLRRNYYRFWLSKYADELARRSIYNDAVATAKIIHEIEYLRQEVNALKKLFTQMFVQR